MGPGRPESTILNLPAQTGGHYQSELYARNFPSVSDSESGDSNFPVIQVPATARPGPSTAGAQAANPRHRDGAQPEVV